MGATEWITTLILGGILGMIGQGIRVITGLKKVNDNAMQKGKTFIEFFQVSTLGISLLIGFIAGALAIIGITGGTSAPTPSKEIIMAIIGAGYAGTDFIEGFIKKNLPATQQGTNVITNTDENDQPAMG